MKSIASSPEQPDILTMDGNRIVAGYFEQGRWIEVTFEQYLQIFMESAEPQEYLKPANGFTGIRIVKLITPLEGCDASSIAIPVFGQRGNP